MDFTVEELSIIRRALMAQASETETDAQKQQGVRNFEASRRLFRKAYDTRRIVERIDNYRAITHE